MGKVRKAAGSGLGLEAKRTQGATRRFTIQTGQYLRSSRDLSRSRFDGTAGWPTELLGRAGTIRDDGMRTIVGSACLVVMLLPAPLSGASPSGATAVVAGEPMSGPSHLQTAQAACAPPDSGVAQTSAGEPDKSRPVETGQSAAPAPSSVPTAADSVCKALATAAAENDLPIDFFTRLIWQESRFDPVARATKCTISERDGRRGKRSTSRIPHTGLADGGALGNLPARRFELHHDRRDRPQLDLDSHSAPPHSRAIDCARSPPPGIPSYRTPR
jgi:hypothetical protein